MNISMKNLDMYIGLAASRFAATQPKEQELDIMETGSAIASIIRFHLTGEAPFSKNEIKLYQLSRALICGIMGEQPEQKPAGEDKQEILNALLPALQKTRNLEDLETLIYIKGEGNEEFVVATFDSGNTKTINVAMDSGTAMIKNVISQIV